MSVNVLIADDSAFQRKVISDMLTSHKSIDVVATARNGKEAVKLVDELIPDVVILDLIMPEMDGLTAFQHIIENHPIPIIIFSVLDPNTMDKSVQALLMGAFDYIIKPGGEWKVELPKFQNELISKVLLASKSKIKKIKKTQTSAIQKKPIAKRTKKRIPIPVFPADYVPDLTPIRISKLESNVIVMGASVGGPKTLKSILSHLPKDFPSPILIVQHLNEHFVHQFVHSLNGQCEIGIKVAENGETIRSGIVYVAPGDRHMEISVTKNNPIINIRSGKPVNFCIPSIDVLFYSALRVYKDNILGILLTGMGEDGVAGLGAIQDIGGKTITESKETCVLYGMPKIAAERGVADMILPDYEIDSHMLIFAKKFKN